MLVECKALWIGCLPFMQEVEGLTPTGGTCSNNFYDPINQDIGTQCALSWKIVVSEWRLVTAVSLNVGGGVSLITLKNCICACKNTKRTDARCWVCVTMHGFVPLSHSGNVVTRIGLQQQQVVLQANQAIFLLMSGEFLLAL